MYEALLKSLRREGLQDWFLEARPLLVADTLVTYALEAPNLIRHECPNESRFELKEGYIKWLTSSTGIYCFYRELLEHVV